MSCKINISSFTSKYLGFSSVNSVRNNYLVQWLAFRDDGKNSAADYAKNASERISKDRALGELSSWNRFEKGQAIKRRQYFIIKLLQGVMRGLAYMHDHDRLHQSLGPFSVVLKYAISKDLILFKIFHLSYNSLSFYH